MHAPVRRRARFRVGRLGRLGAILTTSALALGFAAPAAQAEAPADAVASFTFDEAPVDGVFTSGDVPVRP